MALYILSTIGTFTFTKKRRSCLKFSFYRMIQVFMGRIFKAIGSILVIFLIFFGVPVLVYSSFQKFLGMVPPAQLIETAIYQLAVLKGVESLILIIIFLLVIERRRGKETKYAFFISILLFLQVGGVAELWAYLTLKSPVLYTAAGMSSAFISYMLAAWFLGKFYQTRAQMILPS